MRLHFRKQKIGNATLPSGILNSLSERSVSSISYSSLRAQQNQQVQRQQQQQHRQYTTATSETFRFSRMTDDLDDVAERLEDRAVRGGRMRAGGRRGGGGASGPPNRDMLVSKALSTLLRHQAGNAGVELDAEGFARLDQVVSL
jgi:hypothetical protein